MIAVAEFTIGVALVAGLFTRITALGQPDPPVHLVMSGTASVWYALFAIVILTKWRAAASSSGYGCGTSSWPLAFSVSAPVPQWGIDIEGERPDPEEAISPRRGPCPAKPRHQPVLAAARRIVAQA